MDVSDSAAAESGEQQEFQADLRAECTYGIISWAILIRAAQGPCVPIDQRLWRGRRWLERHAISRASWVRLGIAFGRIHSFSEPQPIHFAQAGPCLGKCELSRAAARGRFVEGVRAKTTSCRACEKGNPELRGQQPREEALGSQFVRAELQNCRTVDCRLAGSVIVLAEC